MGLLGSTVLKLIGTFLYAITFCCAAAILGIYSYFLAVLSSNDLAISGWKKAVEGISGAAVVYLFFAVILTCFIGGIRVFATLAMVLNLLFAAAFIAIAVLARDGADSCTGLVQTPLGDGPATAGRQLFDPGQNQNNRYNNYGFGPNASRYAPDLGFACRVNRTAFILAIVGAILFLIMIAVQLLLARKHKEDKQFQAAPSTHKRKFWQRKKGHRSTHPGAVESGYAHTKPEPQTYDPHSMTGTTNTAYTPTTTSNYGSGAPAANYNTTGNTYTGTTAMPGTHTGPTYDTSGRPISNPYQTGPTGPYTNY